MARIRADLRGWLSEVVSRIEEWAPLAIELSFGLKSDEEYDSKSVLDPVKVLDAFLLSGSIDVVEQHASGIKRVSITRRDTRERRPPGHRQWGSTATDPLRSGSGTDPERASIDGTSFLRNVAWKLSHG